jgi:hypothetical protein
LSGLRKETTHDPYNLLLIKQTKKFYFKRGKSSHGMEKYGKEPLIGI